MVFVVAGGEADAPVMGTASWCPGSVPGMGAALSQPLVELHGSIC